jgi:hypothetical protein
VRQTIAIKGLKEFSKALRKMDSEAVKQLRVVFNEAAELIIAYARPRIPKRTGRAANSLKKRSTRTSVRIAFGGDRAPYYPWLDFGGATGKNKSVQRPFLKEGRYVYKGFKEKRSDVERAMSDGIRRVAQSAGLEVD